MSNAAIQIDDGFEYLRGQCDCREGIAHKAGQSESYDQGYSSQYEWEQVKSAQSMEIENVK